MNKRAIYINMVCGNLSLFGNIIIGFILTPYLVTRLGKETYAFFPMLLAFVSYSGVITAALNAMASRFITISIIQKQDKEANSYFNTVFWGNLFLAMLILGSGITIIPYLNNFFIIPASIKYDVKWTYVLILLNTSLLLCTSVFSIVTFVHNKIHINSIVSLVSTSMRGLLLFLVFSRFQPSLIWLSGIALVLAVGEQIYYLILFHKLLPQIKMDITLFSFPSVNKLILSGIWFSIDRLGIILFTGLNLWLANKFVSPADAGDLAIVQIFPSYIGAIIFVIANAYAPTFTILFAEHNQDKLLESLSHSIGMISFFINIPIAFLACYGDVFLNLWLPHQQYQHLYHLMIFLVLPVILSGCIHTLYTMNITYNKVYASSIILIITGIINILLVFILLKFTNLGIWVLLGVNLFLYIMRTIFLPIYVTKYMNIKWHTFFPAMFKAISALLVMASIGMAAKQVYIPMSWGTLIVMGIGLTLVWVPVSAFIVFPKPVIYGFFTNIVEYYKKYSPWHQ